MNSRNPTDAGILTSEFALTILNKIFVFIVGMTLLILVGMGRLTVDEALGLMPAIITVIAGTTATTGAYSLSRGLAKKK